MVLTEIQYILKIKENDKSSEDEKKRSVLTAQVGNLTISTSRDYLL